MKKEGEPSLLYRGAAHLVFVLFIVYVISLFFMHPELFGEGDVTGHAVYEESEAKQKIEDAFSNARFMNEVSSLKMCLQINDGDTEHIFKVRKSPAGMAVTNSDGFCDGRSTEDLIVKFGLYL